MKVTICGPNLRNQSKGAFHVHTDGCADLTKNARREPAYKDGWTIDAYSKQEIVEAIYEDQMREEAHSRGSQPDWHEYDDVHLFPCVDLPDTYVPEDNDDEDTQIGHYTEVASKHGASDGEQTAAEAMTFDSIMGYLENNLDSDTLENAPTDDLDQIGSAYVEAFIDAFTERARESLREFLLAEDADED